MELHNHKRDSMIVWVWHEGEWHKVILSGDNGVEDEDDVDQLMSQEQFFQMARNNAKKTIN